MLVIICLIRSLIDALHLLVQSHLVVPHFVTSDSQLSLNRDFIKVRIVHFKFQLLIVDLDLLS